MNKIVNGVANDYEFPMYYESNIKTSRDKDSVIAMTYVNQEKEIERLNKIIAELENWLNREIYRHEEVFIPSNPIFIENGELHKVLDKLKELKEKKDV